LVNKNAALLCRDAEATQKLGDMLISLIQNDEQIAALQSEIIKLGLPQAAESIVREIVQDLGR
jgi:UDP-N-acetylglucosamine:LPS N-acetylglucosamine transferase